MTNAVVRRAAIALVTLCSSACGPSASTGDGASDANTPRDDRATMSDAAARDASGAADAAGASSPDATSSAMDATATDSGARDAARDTGGATPDGSTANPTVPAMPAGGCPVITPNADVTFMLPSGARRAYFRYDPARLDADSALVLAWEQSGGMGGLSATNYAASGMRPNDVLVGPYKPGQFYDRVTEIADAVVACAVAQLHVNVRRIGTVGFSAGANAAWDLVSQRSSYVAAAALFSAGTSGSASAAGNRYSLMVGYGSATADTPFYGLTTGIRDSHVTRGYPVVSCSHGMGHRFPPESAPAVGRFLVEHPWGTRPTPWTTRPAGAPLVPAYCTVSNPG